MPKGAIEQLVADLSHRLAVCGDRDRRQVLREWYNEVTQSQGKRTADAAYRLFSLAEAMYAAGKMEGEMNKQDSRMPSPNQPTWMLIVGAVICAAVVIFLMVVVLKEIQLKGPAATITFFLCAVCSGT